jgi:hypothetical protein
MLFDILFFFNILNTEIPRTTQETPKRLNKQVAS